MVLIPSKETNTMLKKGRGYRCESYAELGEHLASEVVNFEIFALGNDHIAQDACAALGLRDTHSECAAETDDALNSLVNEIKDAIEKNFGLAAKAVWLGEKDDVKEHYCEEDEEPDEIKIGKDWLAISQIGPDGTLFIRPSEPPSKKAKELVKKQREALW